MNILLINNNNKLEFKVNLKFTNKNDCIHFLLTSLHQNKDFFLRALRIYTPKFLNDVFVYNKYYRLLKKSYRVRSDEYGEWYTCTILYFTHGTDLSRLLSRNHLFIISVAQVCMSSCNLKLFISNFILITSCSHLHIIYKPIVVFLKLSL